MHTYAHPLSYKYTCIHVHVYINKEASQILDTGLYVISDTLMPKQMDGKFKAGLDYRADSRLAQTI